MPHYLHALEQQSIHVIHEAEQTRQSERAGRPMDHEREDTFERLRAVGYT